MNYAELVAAVTTYTQNTYPTADMNIMIQQAEKRIYNSVQLANMRKNITSNLISNNPYISPPSDFLSAYSCAIFPANTTGPYVYLLDKDVNFIRESYPTQTDTGQPRYYALFGAETGGPTTLSLMFGPTPDAAYGIELHYYYYPESIVTAGTTWLGEHFDIALFNGTMMEAITYMKGEQDLVQLYSTRFAEAIVMLKSLGDGKQRSDAYRNGQTRVKVT
jgi:hypothetical protein